MVLDGKSKILGTFRTRKHGTVGGLTDIMGEDVLVSLSFLLPPGKRRVR